MKDKSQLIEKLDKLETLKLRDVMDEHIIQVAEMVSDSEKSRNFIKQLDEKWVRREDVKDLLK